MSYYVRFKVSWGCKGFSPRSSTSRKAVLERVEEYLRRDGTYDVNNWIDEFRAAFVGRGIDIKVLEEEWSIRLVSFVSSCFPDVPFHACGRGEVPEDAWRFTCLNGELIHEASHDGERSRVEQEGSFLSACPEPLDITRVVSQAGSRSFIAEILKGQPVTAMPAALTIRRKGDRRPRALVYAGPLEQDAFERIRDLIEDRYRVQQFRNISTLRTDPTATAMESYGY